MKKFGGLLIILFLFSYPLACTNLQIGQASLRFAENMSGRYRNFSDYNPANPASFTFSAMGDAHIGSAGGDLFQPALTRSKASGDLFSVVLGDNSNTGQEAELTTFNLQAAAAGMTIYPIIGNHDIFFGGWNNYKSIIGRSIYSFNAGNVHFTALDSANGTIGEDQLNWLTQDLQNTSKPIKIVMLHYPVYIKEFTSIYKLASDEEITILKNLFRNLGVQLVLSGHYHGFADNTLGGVRYVVTGGCNHILDPGNNSGYVRITVSGSSLGVSLIQL